MIRAPLSLAALAASTSGFTHPKAFLAKSVASRAATLSSLYATENGYDYDMLVIGGGSGGVRASRISAGHGAKVAILEPQLKHGAPGYSAIGGKFLVVFSALVKAYV